MGVNPRSRRQQKIASDLANLRPFTGTLNADTDPETGHYVVRSYRTPIARVETHPETGRMIRSLSEQRFSPTTTQHQHIVRTHLPGSPGPAIGEQDWTRQASGAFPNAVGSEYSMPRRQSSNWQPRPAPSSYTPSSYTSPDMAHGMLTSELFHDRREESGSQGSGRREPRSLGERFPHLFED
jgi:hypothetical protein